MAQSNRVCQLHRHSNHEQASFMHDTLLPSTLCLTYKKPAFTVCRGIVQIAYGNDHVCINYLHSQSLSCLRCSLVLAIHTLPPSRSVLSTQPQTFNFRETFQCAHFKFTISDWSKLAYTCGTRPSCSVGLAQVCPNNCFLVTSLCDRKK